MAVFKSKHSTWGFNIYVREKPRIRKQGFKTKAEATLEMSKVLNDVSSGKYFKEDRHKNLLKPTLCSPFWVKLYKRIVSPLQYSLSLFWSTA